MSTFHLAITMGSDLHWELPYCSLDIDIDREYLDHLQTTTRRKPLNRYDRANLLTSSVHLSSLPHKRARKNAKFRSLLDMPLDITIEILSYLHPLSLLHISTLNKSHRNAFLSPQMNFVWRTAFREHGLPALILPLTEGSHSESVRACFAVQAARWMYLIYGASICWDCKTHHADPDFIFRRRLCHDCLKKLTYEILPKQKNPKLMLLRNLTSEIGTNFPHTLSRRKSTYDDIKRSLEHYTQLIEQEHGYPNRNRYRDAAELEAECQYEKFIRKRREEVEMEEERQRIWKGWYHGAYTQAVHAMEIQQKKAEREGIGVLVGVVTVAMDRKHIRVTEMMTEIERWLKEDEGYDACDVYCAREVLSREVEKVVLVTGLTATRKSRGEWKEMKEVARYWMGQVVRKRRALEEAYRLGSLKGGFIV